MALIDPRDERIVELARQLSDELLHRSRYFSGVQRLNMHSDAWLCDQIRRDAQKRLEERE